MMVDRNNMIDNNIEGLWKHILHHSPKPEHLEIEKMIGTQLINHTKILWNELKNLKDIIYQVSDDKNNEDVNQLKDDMKKMKITTKNTINQAIQYSQLCYHNDNNSEKILETNPILYILYSTNKFTSDNIAAKLDDIHEAFIIENKYVESEIDRLTLYLDDDINSKLDIDGMNKLLFKSSLASSTDEYQDNHNNNKKLTDQPLLESIFKNNSSIENIHQDSCMICKLPYRRKTDKMSISNTTNNNICLNCQTKKKKKASTSSTTIISNDIIKKELSKSLKTSQSIPNSLLSSSIKQANNHNHMNDRFIHTSNNSSSIIHNNNDDSPNSITSGKSNQLNESKFRKRLNSARSELHFLDEF